MVLAASPAFALSNNEAIKLCWEIHKPSYELAAGCAHEYIAENTRNEVEAQRKYNKENPPVYWRPRWHRY